MTLNNRHIRNSSFTPSPAQTALKKIAKLIGIILATLIGLLMWAIVKPIFRGVGWVISIITTLMIIYWICLLYTSPSP
ncbi:hypothetical protein, partial [Bacteroides acidifaciens]|uniref:hypothetical protein n=1 Tax=Bacteroides acidifaciens TaxID=85831 RepID=UPI00259A4EF3